MFSTGEYDYIKNLTLDYYNHDYTYYLCISNNPTNYSNNNVYDVNCYYSKKPMYITNNQLVLPTNTIECNFDSNNYSDNNTIDKLTCSDSTGTVSLSTKEYVYSNIGNYSNIIADYENTNTFYNSLELISLSILAMIVILFLYKFVSKILRS